MHILESGVIGRHAVVLQARDDLHAVFGLVLLRQGDGNLLCAVVAEVEKDHDVTFLDSTIDRRVNDGLDELIGHTLVIGLLDGTHHVVTLLALAGSEHVIGNLDAVPVVVAVHCIVTANNGCYGASTLLAVLCYRVDEAFAALGVGVATVHETVHEYLLQAIFLSDVAQGHEVLL